jgi:Zn-finger nucleic acid-binding protein
MTVAERTCPRCTTALTHLEDGALVLDHCRSCGGLFLDDEEWKPLVGSVRSIDRPQALSLDFRRSPCPACGHAEGKSGLVPRGLRGGGELEIDVCEACGGAWLDAGELEHARAAARLLGEERRRLAQQHREREQERGRRAPAEQEQGLLESLVEAWQRLLGK